MNCFGIIICKKIKEGYKYNNFGCPNKIPETIIWKKFLASILNQTTDLNKYDKPYSEWYESAREILKMLIRQNYKKYLLEYFESKCFEDITFRCPTGKGKETINRIKISNNSFKNVRTIHSVKGQTFDSILLVSNDNMGKGTNWREWLGDKKSENARIAYVASSRPKRLLIWAVSNINKEEKEKLNKLGLEELIIK